MARNIRLVNPDQPDATDIHSLVASVTKGCKSDQEKMIALWAYITRNPYYHWCEARENPEGTTELGVVFDPISALNVHGTVICYQVSDLLANLGDAAGVKTRCRGVPGHKVMEAFYDGKWHFYDPQYDCASYFVADDGKRIISLDELLKDSAKYIRKPKHPSKPFYQFDHFGGKFWPWETKEYVIKKFYPRSALGKCPAFAPYIARGHTIHMDLRRGEKLIRNFANVGKWFCPPDFYDRWNRDRTQRWVDKGPHDPRKPANTHANGELIYEPDWAASESNLLDGLYGGKDFVLADGVVRPKGGKCHVVFSVQSPYLIAGKPGKLAEAGDSRDGAIFQAEFIRKNAKAVNAVAVSTDNGITWKDVWTNDKLGRRTIRLDLTNHVEGNFGYLVKVALAGAKGEDAGLAKLSMRTSLFYSPVPLPAVGPGTNRFKFSLERGKGVLLIRPDLGDGRRYKRFFHELKGLKYDRNFVRHLSPTGRSGHAVVEVAGPPGSKVERLTVDACYGTSGGRGADKAEILYASDPAGEWKSAWKSDFSVRNDKWKWDCSAEIALPRPAEKCYLKFLLTRSRWMSLNRVKIYAHYVRAARPLEPGSVKATHVWDADGRKGVTHAATPKLTGETYSFEVKGKRIANKSVTVEVLNDK